MTSSISGAGPLPWSRIDSGPCRPFLRRQFAGSLPTWTASSFAVREKAAVELEKLGLQAEPALRRSLAAKPSLETSRRLEQLLEKLEKSSDWLRTRRAVRLLAWIDSAKARQVLAGLAAGSPDAMPTREAKAALKSPLRRSFR